MTEITRKISCVIPTFKRADFLNEALNSVLRQSLRPFEIIVVNNGGEKLNLPEDFVKRGVIVADIVFRAGASQARNFGAAISRGEYVAFLDDDDLWSERYLENVASAIRNGARCVVSRLDKLRDKKIFSYKNADGKMRIEKFLVSNPGLTGSNVVIERETFLKIGGFDSGLPTSNDKSFAIEVLRNGVKTAILPENQAITREHSEEKLTGKMKSAIGTYLFIEKYRSLMSLEVYIVNMAKLFKYRFEGGRVVSFLPYVAYSLVAKIFGIFH